MKVSELIKALTVEMDRVGDLDVQISQSYFVPRGPNNSAGIKTLWTNANHVSVAFGVRDGVSYDAITIYDPIAEGQAIEQYHRRKAL